MKDVVEYRAHFYAQHQPRFYHGYAHAAFTVFSSVGIIVYALLQTSGILWWEWLCLPLTFIYTNAAEYFAHRGPMHHPRRGLRLVYERHSRQHHRYFTHQHMEMNGPSDYYAVLFPPVLILFFALVYLLPMGVVLSILVSPNVAWLYLAMTMAYFLNYELFHFIWHLPETHPIFRLPFLGRMRQLHLRHHDPKLMSSYNFNISYPLFDHLMGTLYASSGKKTD